MLSLMGKRFRLLKIVISTIWQKRTAFLTEMNYNYKQWNQRPVSQLGSSLGFKKNNHSRQVTCYNCTFLTQHTGKRAALPGLAGQHSGGRLGQVQWGLLPTQLCRAQAVTRSHALNPGGAGPGLTAPDLLFWLPSRLSSEAVLPLGCRRAADSNKGSHTSWFTPSRKRKKKRKECSLPLRDANHSSWYDWVSSTLCPLLNKGRCQGRATSSKVRGSGHPWELETMRMPTLTWDSAQKWGMDAKWAIRGVCHTVSFSVCYNSMQ